MDVKKGPDLFDGEEQVSGQNKEHTPFSPQAHDENEHNTGQQRDAKPHSRNFWERAYEWDDPRLDDEAGPLQDVALRAARAARSEAVEVKHLDHALQVVALEAWPTTRRIIRSLVEDLEDMINAGAISLSDEAEVILESLTTRESPSFEALTVAAALIDSLRRSTADEVVGRLLILSKSEQIAGLVESMADRAVAITGGR